MLVDAEKLPDHLREEVEGKAREVYLLLANADLPPGMTVRPSGHGYISRELRFEMSGRWLFSAVLNKKWVLWYFRLPALKSGQIDAAAIRADFPEAEANNRGELKIRLSNTKEAERVLSKISPSLRSGRL